MQYFLKNIENKLKISIHNDKSYINVENSINIFHNDNVNYLNKNSFTFFITCNLLFKFLFFSSKKLVNTFSRKKNFLLFIKLFNYLNFYFFKNKIYSFKNFFFKKNLNFLYLNRFFFNLKYINPRKGLIRLKEKRTLFFKKNI